MGNETSTPGKAKPEQGAPESEVAGNKLYKYLVDRSQWQLLSNSVRCRFYDENEDANDGTTLWKLEIEVEGDSEGVDEAVTQEMSLVEGKDESRVTFVAAEQVWAIKFCSQEAYSQFVEEFENKLFENVYAVAPDSPGRKKILGEWSETMFNAKPTDAAMDWEVAPDDPVEEKRRRSRRQSHVPMPVEAGESISNMRIGAGARSYVARGSQIDVLNNVEGGVEATNLSFMLTPTKNGPAFTPSKLMLCQTERHLNMLTPDPSRRSKVYNTDIETGKVVTEWSFDMHGVEVPMLDICNDTKAAQLEDRSTFLGLDGNRLCRWDMRTQQGVVDDLTSPIVNFCGGKDYARGTNFTCMATSGDGFVVTGSVDGKVRLYNNKPTSFNRAATSIPGLGAPITAVDVTYDGKWVVATTNRYIMVVNTSFKDKKGVNTVGFKSSMGPKNAPAPKLLRLRPEDLAKLGHAPFTKAKFTWITQDDRQERHIVASCGSHTVVWNFQHLKAQQPSCQSSGLQCFMECYTLTENPEMVVDSSFMHDNFLPAKDNNSNAVVVATGHNLFSYAEEDEDEF